MSVSQLSTARILYHFSQCTDPRTRPVTRASASKNELTKGERFKGACPLFGVLHSCAAFSEIVYMKLDIFFWDRLFTLPLSKAAQGCSTPKGEDSP